MRSGERRPGGARVSAEPHPCRRFDRTTEALAAPVPRPECTRLGTEDRAEPRRAAASTIERVRAVLAPLLIAALLVPLAAGCGAEEDRLPTGCTNGADGVRAALHAAPGRVRVDGMPLSACLDNSRADASELQTVGVAFVEAAVPLARLAARRPEGRAALELGYLMGASSRGASSQVGVHAELVRRLRQELTGVDVAAAAFRRGELAGRRNG